MHNTYARIQSSGTLVTRYNLLMIDFIDQRASRGDVPRIHQYYSSFSYFNAKAIYYSRVQQTPAFIYKHIYGVYIPRLKRNPRYNYRIASFELNAGKRGGGGDVLCGAVCREIFQALPKREST